MTTGPKTLEQLHVNRYADMRDAAIGQRVPDGEVGDVLYVGGLHDGAGIRCDLSR
jgi:hypothetical protein